MAKLQKFLILPNLPDLLRGLKTQPSKQNLFFLILITNLCLNPKEENSTLGESQVSNMDQGEDGDTKQLNNEGIYYFCQKTERFYTRKLEFIISSLESVTDIF